VDDPQEAWLHPAVRADLARLAASARLSLGVISGRRLHDLRRRVALPGLIYAGCHGLEISGPGLAFRHAEAMARSAALRQVVQQLQAKVATVPGVVIEPKSLGAAVHYRRARPEVVRPLVAEIRAAVTGWPGLRLAGRKAIEILPTPRWDKGRCILWIESRLHASAGEPVRSVYLGDDATDEFAFRALAGRAVTVKVGRGGRTWARHRVRGVRDVHRILRVLAGLVQRRGMR